MRSGWTTGVAGLLAGLCVAVALSCDWGDLDGIPAGFADGVDDELAFESSGSDWGVADTAARSDHYHDDYETRIAALEAKLAKVTATTDAGGHPALVISGANVYVDNGTGTTEGAVNGTGNLIVGYNELRGGGDVRTGSHNIVVGRRHNYSSFGGIAAGLNSTISGAYAAVSGGNGNTADGAYASVSGGSNNAASGYCASVSGGQNNTASANYTSVSGGSSNEASGNYASVSGGSDNTASGNYSHVCGGYLNTASADLSNVP